MQYELPRPSQAFYGATQLKHLPETRFLRIWQIIGQDEVTEEQAAANRANNKNPKRTRPAIPARIPIKKSTWWAGVKSGRYPKPTKAFGKKIAAWDEGAIHEIIQQAADIDTSVTPDVERRNPRLASPSKQSTSDAGRKRKTAS
jgi:prophage regulatory protein